MATTGLRALSSGICTAGGDERRLTPPTFARVPRPRQSSPMMGNVNEGKGLFAPLVVVTRNLIGKKRFNQLREKAIALHSQAEIARTGERDIIFRPPVIDRWFIDGIGTSRIVGGVWAEHVRCAYSVMMGSSPRFDMYGCDFGWGKAVALRSGGTIKFDGKVSSYPRREGRGSVDLEVCLKPEYMRALELDEEFMAFVSSPQEIQMENLG